MRKKKGSAKKTSFPGKKRRMQTRNRSKTLAKHRSDKQEKHESPGKTRFSSRPRLYRNKFRGIHKKRSGKKKRTAFPPLNIPNLRVSSLRRGHAILVVSFQLYHPCAGATQSFFPTWCVSSFRPCESSLDRAPRRPRQGGEREREREREREKETHTTTLPTTNGPPPPQEKTQTR